MSCSHGNHPDTCEICYEVDAAYKSGVADGRASPANGAVGEMPEPVAYLKFWAAQSWGGSGNQDIDYGEGLATCEKEEVGDDKLPAFAVYSADQLRAAVLAERASGPNAALVEALKKLARHGEYGTATELVARAALAAVGVQHV